MSEWNTIFDTSNEIIGTFRHGVAWCKQSGKRLGEYDESTIYDNNRAVIATIEGDVAFSTTGTEIGRTDGRSLIVGGAIVGSFIGHKHAGAAALVYFFSDVSENAPNQQM